MSRKKEFVMLVAGAVIGMALVPAAQAATEYLTATRSNQPVYVDGQRVSIEAYAINGNNYVKLRDIGAAVDMNVYWDGSAVQVDTHTAYTGAPPATPFTQSADPAKVLAAPAPESLVPTMQTGSKTNPSSRDIEAQRQEIIDRTNAVRVQNGLPALPADPMLMKAAQVRAEEMAATTTYSHTRPDGSFCRTVTDCPYISENIHRIICDFIDERGISAAEFAVRGWTCSEGHLRNILQDGMSGIGVGLAIGVNDFGEESWYCVQQFICKGCTITWVDAPKIP